MNKNSDWTTGMYNGIKSFIYTVSYWIVFTMVIVNFVRFYLLTKASLLLGRMPHLEDSFRTAIKPRLFGTTDETILLFGALIGHFILPIVLFFFILLKNYRGIFITIILLAVEILFWNIDGSMYLMDFN